MPNPTFQRASVSGSPLTSHQHPSRKPSIVELLSSPPPLPQDHSVNDDIHSFSLSRNPSVSSRNSKSSTPLDWTEVSLGDLTESNKLISIDAHYSVQKAFQTLTANKLTSLPVSMNKDDGTDLSNCMTFDYSDLNTYLLLIMNKIPVKDLAIDQIGNPLDPNEKKVELLNSMVTKGKHGEDVPVELIIKLHPKNPFIKFTENDTLFLAMETLGNGVHRVAITDPELGKITGILSQRRLIKYMWENARRFPSLEFYLNSTLEDLKIGSTNPITIYEDQPLIDALNKMFVERVTSLAVIDRSKSLIGNISIVDVKNVTSSKNSHLLFKTVLNFISYNLSQKGIEEGQDQFPIFHVDNSSSLGRVIAKLVATQSHRLWIVEKTRSSVSTGSTNGNTNKPNPGASPTTIETALNSSSVTTNATIPIPETNYGLPGKLIGVVTLTDILGLFASSKGRKTDPHAARNQRRRSSTSTTRSSMDSSISIGGGVSISGPTQPSTSNADSKDIFRKSYTKDNGFTTK
jgi:CBS domain-containing protein